MSHQTDPYYPEVQAPDMEADPMATIAMAYCGWLDRPRGDAYKELHLNRQAAMMPAFSEPYGEMRTALHVPAHLRTKLYSSGRKSYALPQFAMRAFLVWLNMHHYRVDLDMQRGKLTAGDVHLGFPIRLHYDPGMQVWAGNNAAIKKFYLALDEGHIKGFYSPTPEPETEPNSSKGNNMSELNAAAFMRDNAKTVHVTFIGENAGEKTYTYVTTLQLQKDDIVVVPARSTFALAKVAKADDDLMLEPKANVKYSWVVTKVDMAAYETLLEENAKITEVIRKSYQHNARTAFRELLLNGVSPEVRDELKKLTSS